MKVLPTVTKINYYECLVLTYLYIVSTEYCVQFYVHKRGFNCFFNDAHYLLVVLSINNKDI